MLPHLQQLHRIVQPCHELHSPSVAEQEAQHLGFQIQDPGVLQHGCSSGGRVGGADPRGPAAAGRGAERDGGETPCGVFGRGRGRQGEAGQEGVACGEQHDLRVGFTSVHFFLQLIGESVNRLISALWVGGWVGGDAAKGRSAGLHHHDLWVGLTCSTGRSQQAWQGGSRVQAKGSFEWLAAGTMKTMLNYSYSHVCGACVWRSGTSLQVKATQHICPKLFDRLEAACLQTGGCRLEIADHTRGLTDASLQMIISNLEKKNATAPVLVAA